MNAEYLDYTPGKTDEETARKKARAEIKTGQETYAIQTTNDNLRLLFTNRYSDAEGLGILTVTDDAVNKTTVILGDMQKGGNLPSSLFSITDEAEKRN